MMVTSATVDQEVACGFSVQGKEFRHKATLDIIDITSPEKVEIGEDGEVDIACTISGSKHVEPIKSIWYKGELTSVLQSNIQKLC